MTAPHQAPPLAVADVEEATAEVRARGLRITAARRLVIEALFAAGEPVSVEDVAAGLDGRLPPSDIGSVYRNLERLEAIGLVHHVHLGHGAGLYALAGVDPAYIVCDICGRHDTIREDRLAPIRDAVRDHIGWEARFRHFPIVGLCPSCFGRTGSELRAVSGSDT